MSWFERTMRTRPSVVFEYLALPCFFGSSQLMLPEGRFCGWRHSVGARRRERCAVSPVRAVFLDVATGPSFSKGVG